MKKLMIAAAAAALVGGAFASDEKVTAYTFTASLKTTVGKSGKTTTTYNLGKNGSTFWYQDKTIMIAETAGVTTEQKSVVDFIAADTEHKYFTEKKIGNVMVPCLTAAAKANVDWLVGSFKIASFAAAYNQKSANKWCETVKVTESGCYRVAGTKKFSGIVYGDFCCGTLKDGDNVNYDNADVDTGLDYEFSIDATGLSNRFGGLTYATAKKAEIYGSVILYDADERHFAGLLAGQGSVGKVIYFDDNDSGDLDTEDLGITSISGNIVGTLTAPDCQACCSDATTAVAFECGTPTDYYTGDTAAYGTFSLKYNAKATKALD